MKFATDEVASHSTNVSKDINHGVGYRRFTTFCFAIALTAVLGCASSPTQEGTGEYVDDAVITSKVKSAIFGEPSLKSLEISVETFKGVVQLSGFVSSTESESKAVELARSVKGVKSVKDDMRLKK